jgi:hypothetical protein
MEGQNAYPPGVSVRNDAGQEISLLTPFNFRPLIAFYAFLPADETAGVVSISSPGTDSAGYPQNRLRDKLLISLGLLSSPLEYSYVNGYDRPFPQQQAVGTGTEPQSDSDESSSNETDQFDVTVAVHGTPDPSLPDFQRFPGYKEATLETHRFDYRRGLVNKSTGQSHLYTILRTPDEMVVMCMHPWINHVLSEEFAHQHRRSGPGGIRHVVHRLKPWDLQGNVMRLGPAIGTINAHHLPSDQTACALCASRDHRLKDCVGSPDRFSGRMPGCPACNTLTHTFDSCPEVTGVEGRVSMSFERKFELLIFRRQDKPIFETNQSFRYEDFKHFSDKYPLRGMPWSPGFAKEHFDKGGPWLEYNYSDATPELPRDPRGEELLQRVQYHVQQETGQNRTDALAP